MKIYLKLLVIIVLLNSCISLFYTLPQVENKRIYKSSIEIIWNRAILWFSKMKIENLDTNNNKKFVIAKGIKANDFNSFRYKLNNFAFSVGIGFQNFSFPVSNAINQNNDLNGILIDIYLNLNNLKDSVIAEVDIKFYCVKSTNDTIFYSSKGKLEQGLLNFLEFNEDEFKELKLMNTDSMNNPNNFNSNGEWEVFCIWDYQEGELNQTIVKYNLIINKDHSCQIEYMQDNKLTYKTSKWYIENKIFKFKIESTEFKMYIYNDKLIGSSYSLRKEKEAKLFGIKLK